MVNDEICNFLKVNYRFLLVIWVKWKQSVCSITLLYSSTFYSWFLTFFVLEIFKFKYDTFFVRNSAATSKFNWSEQPWCHSVMVFEVHHHSNVPLLSALNTKTVSSLLRESMQMTIHITRIFSKQRNDCLCKLLHTGQFYINEKTFTLWS